MSCINKEQFQKPLGIKVVQYPLPDYGPDAYVKVRSITLADMRRLNAKHGIGEKDTEKNTEFTFDLLATALVDDNGNQLFSDGAEAKEGLNLTLQAFRDLVDFVISNSGLDASKKN